MGSKSAIVKRLLPCLPSADTFVDLFAGGCAVTHAAILSGRYKDFIVNDVNPMWPTLFVDAIKGKYNDESHWISREDFKASTDPYVKVCWSFGNNPEKGYLYSAKIEPYKKACHYAIVLDDWSLLQELCPEVWQVAKDALEGVTDRKQRRLKFGPAIVKWLKANGSVELVEGNPLYKSCHWRGGFPGKGSNDLESLQSLERLERLQSLESLERLQSLESLQSLERLERLERLQRLPIRLSSLDYRSVQIPSNAVVYCDPPYNGKATYSSKDSSKQTFDHDAFYEWALSRPFPVFVSEYSAPMTCVAEFDHVSRLAANGSSSKINGLEKLYFNGTMDEYKALMAPSRPISLFR